MNDWWQTISQPHSPAMGEMGIRLFIASIAGCWVALTYMISVPRKPAESHSMFTTLIMLTMLVAMVSMVIDDQVARAFGLVGALSIVRFRTVVEDTRDTAFVIFAVVVGMALGVGNYLVCLFGLPLVSGVALLLNLWPSAQKAVTQHSLLLRVNLTCEPATMFQQHFHNYFDYYVMESVVTARQGVAYEIQCRVNLKRGGNVWQVVKELHQIEGVQHVELKDI
jgi:uncharacterized membrane protein YhiD involved in acid resistance